MARKTLEQAIEVGVLSVNQAAQLLKMTPSILRRCLALQRVAGAIQSPGTSEIRINGDGLLAFARDNNIKITVEIQTAANNFLANNNPSVQTKHKPIILGKSKKAK